MKRFLLLAFGIMISAGLGVTVSRYTMAFTDNETVTDRIFEEAGISPPSDSTDPAVLESLAASADFPFQHLYLYMYNNVLNGPEKAAIAVLSTQYIDGLKFTEDELTAITQNGDTTTIIEQRQQRSEEAQDAEGLQTQEESQAAADAEFEQFLSDNADALSDSTAEYLRSAYEKQMRPDVPTQEDITLADNQAAVLGVYNDIIDAYNKELDLQRDNRKLAYQALANEMFLNGDLSDSANIDLLYDLDLAHYVLFGSYITYPDRSGGETVELASIPDEFAVEEPLKDQTVSLAEDSVSPYACLDDTALRDALDAFDAEDSTSTAPEETEYSYPDSAEVASEVTSDPDSVESATDAAEEVRRGLESMQDFLTQLNGQKGDWTRSLPCGDVFCITVKLVDGEDDPVENGDYAETDNCVACHVAYINQALTATTDHSLVAGKVSKNWFEDATCKDAGNQVNLDINVYAIKKSIDLDPGDDIDSVPAKDVEDLKQTLIHLNALPTVLGKTPANIECESLLSLNAIAGSSRTLGDVQTQCQEAEDQLAAQLASVYDQSRVEGMNTNQATMYQQVAAELYKMAVSFRNFQEQIQSTYKGDNAPLPALLAKKYCE